jgi:hypothetical protein
MARTFGKARLNNPTIPLFGGKPCHDHALTPHGLKVRVTSVCVSLPLSLCACCRVHANALVCESVCLCGRVSPRWSVT